MQLNPLFATMGATIFEEMSALARETGAINLGQGFPESQGPLALRQAAGRFLIEGDNQYPPMRGVPQLRAAVAEHYGRVQGLSLTSDNVVVTSGATEGLAAALVSVVQPGDEVILFEPAYDAYRPLIEMVGGKARAVRLEPPQWRLDAATLEAAVNPRTRAVLFNNPLNPAARAFDEDELAALAGVCVRHDLIAISDEVWEHLVFDGRRHRPLAGEAGMAERTIKIGSAGKIFSMTGWKIGFMVAQGALIETVARAHQFLTFTTPPNLQLAVAEGLAWSQSWFDEMRVGYAASRDRLSAALTREGFAVLPSEATYFLCVDLKASGIVLDGATFSRRATREHGVAAIPLSSFFDDGSAAGFVRLCFAKSDATLDEAVGRLAQAREAFAR